MGKHFTCDKCGKSFSSIYTLSNHMKIEHNGDCITCERGDCNATFKRKDQYRVHLLKQDGKALFTCVECENGFYNKTHFKSHMTLMPIQGGILAQNVAKCSYTVMMSQNTLIYVVLQKPDLNVKLVHVKKILKGSKQ